MLRRLGRLFVIKNRWEAFAVIYALSLGAVERGFHYMDRYPGFGGWLLFAACTGVVFMAGAALLDHVRRDTGERRRGIDAVPQAWPVPLGGGGAVYRLPVEVRPERAQAFAIRWLVSTARARSEKTMSGRGGDGAPALQGRSGWLFDPQIDGHRKGEQHGNRQAEAADRRQAQARGDRRSERRGERPVQDVERVA